MWGVGLAELNVLAGRMDLSCVALVEIQLRCDNTISVEVDADVNMDGSAGVPARVNGLKLNDAVIIAVLGSAKKRGSGALVFPPTVVDERGVVAAGVCVQISTSALGIGEHDSSTTLMPRRSG